MSETIHRTPDRSQRQEMARSAGFIGDRISIGFQTVEVRQWPSVMA